MAPGSARAVVFVRHAHHDAPDSAADNREKVFQVDGEIEVSDRHASGVVAPMRCGSPRLQKVGEVVTSALRSNVRKIVFAALLSMIPITWGFDGAPASAVVACRGEPATIVGTTGADELTGTAGADVIAGLAGDDNITSLHGSDLVCAGSGNDLVKSGPGSDRIVGQGGSDVLEGSGGPDFIRGGVGRDTLDGGEGRDRCRGETTLNCED